MVHEKASDEQAGEALEKYSVFLRAEKWPIVAMVSWFSTLTSFVYYPAIHQLAQTFAVSIEKINLTITAYIAVATVAPTLLGDAVDVLGRRPVYVLALSLHRSQHRPCVVQQLFGDAGSTNATSPGDFRSVHHSDSKMLCSLLLGTFSVACGVVTDLASPAERRTFVSVVSFA